MPQQHAQGPLFVIVGGVVVSLGLFVVHSAVPALPALVDGVLVIAVAVAACMSVLAGVFYLLGLLARHRLDQKAALEIREFNRRLGQDSSRATEADPGPPGPR
jgi:hypothetical protein